MGLRPTGWTGTACPSSGPATAGPINSPPSMPRAPMCSSAKWPSTIGGRGESGRDHHPLDALHRSPCHPLPLALAEGRQDDIEVDGFDPRVVAYPRQAGSEIGIGTSEVDRRLIQGDVPQRLLVSVLFSTKRELTP